MQSGAMDGDWQGAIERARAHAPFLALALQRAGAVTTAARHAAARDVAWLNRSSSSLGQRALGGRRWAPWTADEWQRWSAA